MVCIHSFYIDLYQHIYTIYDIPIQIPILGNGLYPFFYIDLYIHIYTVHDIPIPILAGGGIGNGSTKFF